MVHDYVSLDTKIEKEILLIDFYVIELQLLIEHYIKC